MSLNAAHCLFCKEAASTVCHPLEGDKHVLNVSQTTVKIKEYKHCQCCCSGNGSLTNSNLSLDLFHYNRTANRKVFGLRYFEAISQITSLSCLLF